MSSMHFGTILGIAAALALASCDVPQPPDPPGIDWAKPVSARRLPTPPPGDRDAAFENLAQPLSAHDARRVLVEATVFAPWGSGLGGRPIQALAINVLLDQPLAADALEVIYQHAEPPGRLLALCGLQSIDPERFARLAQPLALSHDQVTTYGGCIGVERTAGELLSEMATTPVCSEIPKEKERIVAQFRRAR